MSEQGRGQDDASLESLPRMQVHEFLSWQYAEICSYCGGPPQAHPSPEALAAMQEAPSDHE